MKISELRDGPFHRASANLTLRRALVIALAGLLGAAALPAAAQDNYPSKAIRLIVPFGPGNTTDAIARLLATHMGAALGQSIVVDNVAGAGGLTGTTQLVRAPKDGYTLAVVNSAHVINPSIYKSITFDAVKDVAPIGVVGQIPLVLMATNSLPAANVQALVAMAKDKPGAISYGSSGSGGTPHLAAALFTSQAGIDMKHIPYKLSGQMVTDLIAGHISLGFQSSLVVAAQVKGGTLKALAVTSKVRSAAMPDVPTFAEQGLPNYDFAPWIALIAPAGTPKPIVDRLNAELRKALVRPEVKNDMRNFDVSIMDNSVGFAEKFLATEREKHDLIVKASGATAQ